MALDPEVSVVITCYNYGRYIKEAIDSVLCQTYNDYEIIVIDDGSEDDTSMVLKEYRKNNEVRYIYQQNKGQPKAKNRWFSESCGKFIAFFDADDVWFPEKLELQLQLFR